MAAKSHPQTSQTKKRKQVAGAQTEAPEHYTSSKKPKFVARKPSGPPDRGSTQAFKPPKQNFAKSETGEENKAPMSKRERRLHAKVDYFRTSFVSIYNSHAFNFALRR